MIPIQAILIVFIILLGIYFVRRSRSRLAGRLLILSFLFMLSILVLFPDITTWIANRLGVGRGTDFIFYVFALFVLYTLMLISFRLREQDRKITMIVRALAIRDAQPPSQALEQKSIKPDA